jgi:uncharacterized protein YndB with AHSA1/START domain
MPGFTLTGRATAPVEDVWKLLFDPGRFPEWWQGIETVEVASPGDYTIWHEGYPDFPVTQRLRTDDRAGRVVVSCQSPCALVGASCRRENGYGSPATPTLPW